MRKINEHTDSIYKLSNIIINTPNTKKIARSKASGQSYEIVSSDERFYFLRQYKKNCSGNVEKFVQFKSCKNNMAIVHVKDDYIPMFMKA